MNPVNPLEMLNFAIDNFRQDVIGQTAVPLADGEKERISEMVRESFQVIAKLAVRLTNETSDVEIRRNIRLKFSHLFIDYKYHLSFQDFKTYSVGIADLFEASAMFRWNITHCFASGKPQDLAMADQLCAENPRHVVTSVTLLLNEVFSNSIKPGYLTLLRHLAKKSPNLNPAQYDINQFRAMQENGIDLAQPGLFHTPLTQAALDKNDGALLEYVLGLGHPIPRAVPSESHPEVGMVSYLTLVRVLQRGEQAKAEAYFKDNPTFIPRCMRTIKAFKNVTPQEEDRYLFQYLARHSPQLPFQEFANREDLELLFDKMGISPGQRGLFDCMPLVYAFQHRDDNLIRLLLARGTSITDLFTPSLHPEVLEYFQSHPKNYFEGQNNPGQRTKVVVSQLIAMGAKVDSESEFENSLLAKALQEKLTKFQQHYITYLTEELQYRMDKKNIKGETLMTWAIAHLPADSRDIAVGNLIKLGANVNARDLSGRTPMAAAVAVRDPAMITKLINARATDLEVSCDTVTPFEVGVEHDSNLVDLLMKRGVRVPAKLSTGETPLMVSIRRREIHLQKVFLDLQPEPGVLNTVALNGTTALSLAFGLGDIPLVRQLIQRGVVTYDCLNSDGDSVAIWLAKQKNQREALQQVLSFGAGRYKNREGETFLHYAIRVNNPVFCEMALEAGLDLDAKTNKGESPLFYSVVLFPNEVMALELIRGGANLYDTTPSNGEPIICKIEMPAVLQSLWHTCNLSIDTKRSTEKELIRVPFPCAPNRKAFKTYLLSRLKDADDRVIAEILQCAVVFDFQSIITQVIQRKSINFRLPGGDTLLLWSVRNRNKGLFEFLRELPAKADVNIKGNKQSALGIAFDQENVELVLQLLAMGANDFECIAHTNRPSTDGDCLMIWAAKMGRTDIVQELLARRASINMKNNHGETLLHYSVRTRNPVFFKLVMEAKAEDKDATAPPLLADVNALDNEATTPLFIALQDQNVEMSRQLLENGAKLHELTERGLAPVDVLQSQQMLEYILMKRSMTKSVKLITAKEREKFATRGDVHTFIRTQLMPYAIDPTHDFDPLHFLVLLDFALLLNFPDVTRFVHSKLPRALFVSYFEALMHHYSLDKGYQGYWLNHILLVDQAHFEKEVADEIKDAPNVDIQNLVTIFHTINITDPSDPDYFNPSFFPEWDFANTKEGLEQKLAEFVAACKNPPKPKNPSTPNNPAVRRGKRKKSAWADKLVEDPDVYWKKMLSMLKYFTRDFMEMRARALQSTDPDRHNQWIMLLRELIRSEKEGDCSVGWKQNTQTESVKQKLGLILRGELLSTETCVYQSLKILREGLLDMMANQDAHKRDTLQKEIGGEINVFGEKKRRLEPNKNVACSQSSSSVAAAASSQKIAPAPSNPVWTHNKDIKGDKALNEFQAMYHPFKIIYHISDMTALDPQLVRTWFEENTRIADHKEVSVGEKKNSFAHIHGEIEKLIKEYKEDKYTAQELHGKILALFDAYELHFYPRPFNSNYRYDYHQKLEEARREDYFRTKVFGQKRIRLPALVLLFTKLRVLQELSEGLVKEIVDQQFARLEEWKKSSKRKSESSDGVVTAAAEQQSDMRPFSKRKSESE